MFTARSARESCRRHHEYKIVCLELHGETLRTDASEPSPATDQVRTPPFVVISNSTFTDFSVRIHGHSHVHRMPAS